MRIYLRQGSWFSFVSLGTICRFGRVQDQEEIAETGNAGDWSNKMKNISSLDG